MSISRKYGRTFHYPFSPGTTSDDRINSQYLDDIRAIPSLMHTEKLDGENNCLSKLGVFARSHAAPTTSAWTQQLRTTWKQIQHDLGDYEIFGENLYAIHSIAYREIESHFYVFAVRALDKWLSWEETVFIAALFDFATVPVLRIETNIQDKSILEQQIVDFAKQESIFGSIDVTTKSQCSMEGIVSRNAAEFDVTSFDKNVFKYVRKGHVKTDEHWTRNWKRAPLKHERHVDTNEQ